MRRKVAFVVSSCFILVLSASGARADDTIEQVKTTALGLVPAQVTFTLHDPQTAHGLVKVCLSSYSAGQLACVGI